MYTQVDIASRALMQVGANKITSMTEKSKEAEVISLYYDSVLRDVIGRANWTAVRERTSLSADGTTPNSEWDNRFPLPSDYIDLIEVFPELTYKPGYILEAGAILTNETEVDIIYKSDKILTDPSLFTTDLAEAFTLALAAAIAPILSENLNISDDLRKRAEKKIRQAAKGDSHNSNNVKLKPSSWVQSRVSGTSVTPLKVQIDIV